MSPIEPVNMPLSDFLAWNAGTGGGHELIEGEVVPIAPVSETHGLLVSRLTIRIGMRARPPCQMFAEAGIVIPERNTFFVADLVMSCVERQGEAPAIDEPLLVVEVLSRASAALDRGIKLYHYIAVPSVREVLFVDGRRRGGQVWHRDGEGWRMETVEGCGSIHLETTDDTIPLAPIYGSLDLSSN
ncbi:MAG: Uma2 family endonuclease [Alphaproteobacteria bacterium]|nr:Uma2 family endonuclease [Alphaproteobacteria bacterium]